MNDYLLGVITIPAALLILGALAWSIIGIWNLVDEIRMEIVRRRNR